MTVRMTPRSQLALALASSLLTGLFAGCNTDPGKDKPKAEVSAAAENVAPAVIAGATPYKFSQEDSKLTFVAAKVTRQHPGILGRFDGTIQVLDNDATKSSVTATLDLESISVDEPRLTDDLKTDHFFDVAKFPKGSFVSTAVKAGGDNGATHTITGNLSLHGVTKAISFPATIKIGVGSVDVEAEFAIDRQDFAITYPGMPDDLIKNAVSIKLSIHAKKA